MLLYECGEHTDHDLLFFYVLVLLMEYLVEYVLPIERLYVYRGIAKLQLTYDINGRVVRYRGRQRENRHVYSDELISDDVKTPIAPPK